MLANAVFLGEGVSKSLRKSLIRRDRIIGVSIPHFALREEQKLFNMVLLEMLLSEPNLSLLKK